jgi:hypothetical protein
LAYFDALAELLVDQRWIDTLWYFVDGDVAAWSGLWWIGTAGVLGEQFGVYGDCADEVVFVGGDADVGAHACRDYHGGGGFFVVFVCIEVGEGFAGTVGVEMGPDSGCDAGVDRCGKEEEGCEGGMHDCGSRGLILRCRDREIM